MELLPGNTWVVVKNTNSEMDGSTAQIVGIYAGNIWPETVFYIIKFPYVVDEKNGYTSVVMINHCLEVVAS